jgi:subtilisin family serine protease
MKKLIPFTLSFLFILLLSNSCVNPIMDELSSDDSALKSDDLKTNYIVVLNDGDLNLELSKLQGYEEKKNVVKSASDKILKRAGITDGEVEFVYSTALKGFSVKIPFGQLKKLQADPSVSLVEEDMTISLIEPLGKPGGGGGTPAQTTPWGITRVGGPVAYSGTNVAWIIDTGVDFDHPDLNVNTGKAANFTKAKSADDDNGHGSHVAGIIAAKNNTIGTVGVAAGAYVVPVKVLNRSGSGTNSGVIAGIDYVAANASAGDVANMSLGGGVSTALDQAVLNASQVCAFALAAGNETDDANNHSPARVNGPNIYTVSAMGQGDNWASYSNYGNPPVDFCAPGSSIYSCYKGGGYATLSGTSMATPHVAGILLLGSVIADGYVNGDPDGNADPIAHH